MDIMHLMTVADFCQTIGISRSTWHKLKRTGKTPAIITAGGIQRIRREAVEEWIAKNEEQATAIPRTKPMKGCEGLKTWQA